MIKKIVFLILIVPIVGFSQRDTSSYLRAFPITDYIVDLKDSVKLIQLEMPEVIKLKEKQVGVIWGIFNGDLNETVQKGYGKCQLIKGNYYYFAISNNESGFALKKGDLLYTFMEKSTIYYGYIPKLASHFIRLQNVFEEPFYDRYLIFLKWNEADDKKVIDSIIRDIRFTGNYFLTNNASVDKPISEGKYAGQTTLFVMTNCNTSDINDFFDYMLFRPRLYAGNEWKISEIFATWLSEGAPKVIKNNAD